MNGCRHNSLSSVLPKYHAVCSACGEILGKEFLKHEIYIYNQKTYLWERTTDWMKYRTSEML